MDGGTTNLAKALHFCKFLLFNDFKIKPFAVIQILFMPENRSKTFYIKKNIINLKYLNFCMKGYYIFFGALSD